jgi:hypothetical protein
LLGPHRRCGTPISTDDPTASHCDPCGPMRRHLRGQHTQGQHHTTSHLQILRDRDLGCDIAILAGAAVRSASLIAYTAYYTPERRQSHRFPSQPAEHPYPSVRQSVRPSVRHRGRQLKVLQRQARGRLRARELQKDRADCQALCLWRRAAADAIGAQYTAATGGTGGCSSNNRCDCD